MYRARTLSTIPLRVTSFKKLYYIRFDGTGVCVESCPTATNWDALWGCTDEEMTYTVNEGYDCSSSTSTAATCLEKADIDATGAGGAFSGEGSGTCMYQVESVDCEWYVSARIRSLHVCFCTLKKIIQCGYS